MNTIVIPIVSDRTITSGSTGEERIIWTEPSTWQSSVGAVAVLLYLSVLAVSTDAELKVRGQWSLDGKNWKDFDQYLKSSLSAATITDERLYYAGGVHGFEFGPYVRYGVSIADRTSGVEESARLTATIVVQR